MKDLKDKIIPDLYLVILVSLGLLRFGGDHLISALILGALAYGLYKVYPLLRGQEGLGLGDVKMVIASGFWLEPSQIPLYLILGGSIGIGLALLWNLLKKEASFPFGPALAIALGACIVGTNGFSKGGTMTPSFSGPHLSPASGGKPESIVVFIHGYGADGGDLLSLGKVWASLLPHTLFVAPHGPFPCELNPSGKQWFALRDWDPDRILKEIQSLIPPFNQYLDGLLKAQGLPPEKLALVGFSQGAMLALHVALHRPLCAGVVAYSGAFLEDQTTLKMARPPVLLVHGTEDSVLPPSFSEMAEKSLKALHVPVTLSLIPGLAHGIDQKGLSLGGTFLKKQLGENAQSDLWKDAKGRTN